MKPLKQMVQSTATLAMRNYDIKLENFIINSLNINSKPTFLTRLKLKLKRVRIVRQKLLERKNELRRERISIYKGSKLIKVAEFNIKIVENENN